MAQEPIEVFFSYSREDKPLRDKLEIHLSSLNRQGVISAWHDRQIVAGSEWEEEIDRHMRTADIILLLISPDFVASKYCYEIELPDAIARHEAGEACVVPILLRPLADWEYLPFAKLQLYPSGGIPITEWNNQDSAFVDVVRGIKTAVRQLLEKRDREQQEQERRRAEVENARRAEEAKRARRAEESRQTVSATRTQPLGNSQPLITSVPQTVDPKRRQVLKWLGFGGGTFALVVAGQKIWENGRSPALKPFSFEVATVNAKGEEAPRQTKEAKAFVEDLGNGVTLDMVSIPRGTFQMGSPASEEGGYDESPQHSVSVPAFFMGQYAVTQAQYESVIGKNPSNFKGAKRPVETVSWNDAQEFCKKLSQKIGRNYRLPTEAEWEYACRAGTTTPFHFGETITTDLANYRGTDWNLNGKIYPGNYGKGPKGKYREQTTDVDSFLPKDTGFYTPSAFGLYSMHGNVWEWCEDIYHKNYEGAPTNGSAWNVVGEMDTRLLRGGSWFIDPGGCRSAYRRYRSPGDVSTNVGFRVVAVLS